MNMGAIVVVPGVRRSLDILTSLDNLSILIRPDRQDWAQPVERGRRGRAGYVRPRVVGGGQWAGPALGGHPGMCLAGRWLRGRR